MLELVALCNIALNLGLRFAFPYFVGRLMGLPLLNFVTLPILASFPIELFRLVGGPVFLLRDGIASESYQKWLLIENMALAIGLIVSTSICSFAFRRIRPVIAFHDREDRSQALQLAAAVFIAICIASFVLTSSLGYGTINWILNPRTGYQLYRDSVGPFYALMTTSLSVGAFLAFLSVRHSRIKIVVIAAALMPLTYLTGSKGNILYLAILAAQVYLFTFRKIPFWALVLASLPVAALMLAQFGSADLIEVFSYFDYYFNTTTVYEALTNNRVGYFGGAVSGSDFWGLVPRGLYPGKPYVYGGVILSDLLYPGIAEQGSTVGFGGPINAFADFGIAGVIVAAIFDPLRWITALLFGITARIVVDHGPDRMKHEVRYIVMLFILMDFQALAYFTFPLNILFICVIAAVVWLCGFVRIGRSSRAEAWHASRSASPLPLP